MVKRKEMSLNGCLSAVCKMITWVGTERKRATASFPNLSQVIPSGTATGYYWTNRWHCTAATLNRRVLSLQGMSILANCTGHTTDTHTQFMFRRQSVILLHSIIISRLVTDSTVHGQ